MKSFWCTEWDMDLNKFENILKEKNISFTKEYAEGDESTCFIDGYVYTFESIESTIEAQEIHDNL